MRRRGKYNPTIFRTRFCDDIVAEVALPERQTGKVIILASGLPSIPSKRSVLHFLAGEGYAVVFPRYRGTWESDGCFLEQPPTQDVRDVIETLQKEQRFWCAFSEAWIPLQVHNIYLIGSSFGGPAVAALSKFGSVKKVIMLSPVLDWHDDTQWQLFQNERRFIESGFGMATRLKSVRDWDKLRKPNFYSLPDDLTAAARKKIFLIHCSDDDLVPIEPAARLVNQVKLGAYYFKPHGGHLGLGHLTQLFFWHKIKAFFDRK